MKNTNVKHARMRVAGYKIWAGGGGEPRPTGSSIPPPPPHPSRSPPTTDDDVLTAGDPVNFISIVVSVNIGGLSTLSTLSSVSHFSSNCNAWHLIQQQVIDRRIYGSAVWQSSKRISAKERRRCNFNVYIRCGVYDKKLDNFKQFTICAQELWF